MLQPALTSGISDRHHNRDQQLAENLRQSSAADLIEVVSFFILFKLKSSKFSNVHRERLVEHLNKAGLEPRGPNLELKLESVQC